MSFVLDNSVSMRWLFGDGKPHELEYATDILDCLSKATALVPVTWALEVANVIARAEAKDLLTEARSETFLELLADLDIRDDNATSGHALTKTLGLARRYNLSSYDASYLELALREGVPLATLDGDLRKATGKAGVELHLA